MNPEEILRLLEQARKIEGGVEIESRMLADAARLYGRDGIALRGQAAVLERAYRAGQVAEQLKAVDEMMRTIGRMDSIAAVARDSAARAIADLRPVIEGGQVRTAAEMRAMENRTPVESTNLASVGYAPETGALYVEFKGGALYRYNNVRPEVHDALMAAESKGQFFIREIRSKPGQYPFTRLTPPKPPAVDPRLLPVGTFTKTTTPKTITKLGDATRFFESGGVPREEFLELYLREDGKYVWVDGTYFEERAEGRTAAEATDNLKKQHEVDVSDFREFTTARAPAVVAPRAAAPSLERAGEAGFAYGVWAPYTTVQGLTGYETLTQVGPIKERLTVVYMRGAGLWRWGVEREGVGRVSYGTHSTLEGAKAEAMKAKTPGYIPRGPQAEEKEEYLRGLEER